MNNNYIRCIRALHHLQQCLYFLCENVIRKQHRRILDKLPKFQGSCNSCTLDTLLPYHQHELKECPFISKSKCFCSKRVKARTLCPNNGFCSKLCDMITLSHRFRDPFWKNSDPRQWKDNFWMIAVCYINTKGYRDKRSAKETDVRGLLSIIINNIEFDADLKGLQINGKDDLFKKARDFSNELHHSANYVIEDNYTREGINLIRSILEIPQLQNETYMKDALKNFLSDRHLMDVGAPVISQTQCVLKDNSDIDIESPTSTSDDVKDDEKEIKRFQLFSTTNYTEDSDDNNQQRRQEDTTHYSTERYKLSNYLAKTPSPRHPDYVDRNERLRSYARWTHRRPDPHTLCNAGFFYTNDADLVRCFQCGIGLKDFSEDDDPLLEHVRHSSNCPYLQEYIGATQLFEMRRQIEFTDHEFNRQRQWLERHGNDPQSTVYRHPEYNSLEARLASFTGWPTHVIQTPQQLAEAGLYYTGNDDCVRCFACDGGLRRWDPEDDPWTEHCRWFPACPFARIKKGDDYIALIQAAVDKEKQMRDFDNEFSASVQYYELGELQAAMNGKRKAPIEEKLVENENKRKKVTQDEALQSITNETPAEETQRLKNTIRCIKCGQNDTNCLFLPCAHHRVCMECAQSLLKCIVCDREIRQKIRTYIV